MSLKNPLRTVLISSPTLVGSFVFNLLSDQPAKAIEINSNPVSPETQKAPPVNINCNRQNCTGNNHLAAFNEILDSSEIETQEQFPNVEQNEDGHLLLNVSEEESDSAVAMFGCDCVKAINALRQLRGIPIGVEGDRILPGPLIRPCTQRLPEA
jgi:hypothetical protein